MILDYKKRAKLVEHLNYLLSTRQMFLGNDNDDSMDHQPVAEEPDYYKGPVYLHIYGILKFTIQISDDQLIDIAKQFIATNIERANELQSCLIIKEVDNV